jgi:hypothetical protein
MYNFIPLNNDYYQSRLLVLSQNTSIDTYKLSLSLDDQSQPLYNYTVILSEYSDNHNIVIGFYNSYAPTTPIKVIGGKQQAIAEYIEQDGILYFVVLIAGKGFNINFYKIRIKNENNISTEILILDL